MFRLRRYEKILDPPNNKLGFFINPVNGAIAYTIIFVIAQLLSGRLLRQLFPTMTTAYRFVLSLVVPVALWLLGMVPSIPLTLPHEVARQIKSDKRVH